MSQVNWKITNEMYPFCSLNTPLAPMNKENWGRMWGVSYKNGNPLTGLTKVSLEH